MIQEPNPKKLRGNVEAKVCGLYVEVRTLMITSKAQCSLIIHVSLWWTDQSALGSNLKE